MEKEWSIPELGDESKGLVANVLQDMPVNMKTISYNILRLL